MAQRAEQTDEGLKLRTRHKSINKAAQKQSSTKAVTADAAHRRGAKNRTSELAAKRGFREFRQKARLNRQKRS
jgi:hypothetical protein